MKNLCTIAILFLCLAATVPARAGDKDATLQACTRLFGPAIDADENMFEVNDRFVLSVRFDARNRLAQVNVMPKYLFAEKHPDWKEPHELTSLTRTEFEKVLNQLDEISPKGDLLHSVEDGFITNMTERYWDEYEHLFINWLEWWDWYRDDNYRKEVRFFRAYYYRTIQGRVTEKHKAPFGFAEKTPNYYYAIVDGCGYFVTQSTYGRLKRGSNAEFSGAGPIGGIRGAYQCGN